MPTYTELTLENPSERDILARKQDAIGELTIRDFKPTPEGVAALSSMNLETLMIDF